MHRSSAELAVMCSKQRSVMLPKSCQATRVMENGIYHIWLGSTARAAQQHAQAWQQSMSRQCWTCGNVALDVALHPPELVLWNVILVEALQGHSTHATACNPIHCKGSLPMQHLTPPDKPFPFYDALNHSASNMRDQLKSVQRGWMFERQQCECDKPWGVAGRQDDCSGEATSSNVLAYGRTMYRPINESARKERRKSSCL